MLKYNYAPMFIKIAEDIRREIFLHKYKPGQDLGREIDLAENFSVSRVTIRKALAILDKEGLIVRRKKKGTVIAPYINNKTTIKPKIGIIYIIDPSDIVSFDSLLQVSGETGEILRLLQKMDIMPQLCPFYEDQRDFDFNGFMSRHELDGVIINRPLHVPNLVGNLASNKIPHICLESHLPVAGVNTVMGDDEKAAYDSTLQLIKNGHKKIAFIGGKLKKSGMNSGIRRRLDGYSRALSEAGIAIQPSLIKNYNLENIDIVTQFTELAEQILKSDNRPTALVTGIFLGAIGTTLAAQRLKIRIPEDLSLICIDCGNGNGVWAMEQDFYKRLSGYRKPVTTIAQTGLEKLKEWILNPLYKADNTKIPFTRKAGHTLISI